MPRAFDVPAYLARLGVEHAHPPSIDGLKRLQRAQLETVPYETFEIHLSRPTGVDPLESAQRIVDHRRGGYCYHLNGALSELLIALGYRVTRHASGVQGAPTDPPGITDNHLGLTVDGLPSAEAPDGRWLVEAGLGDGPLEPLPLRPGVYEDGLIRIELRWSEAVPGGWRLDHDPRGSFVGVDYAPAPVRMEHFERMHEYLSTSPESSFARAVTAQRRNDGGLDVLRGRVLRRLRPNGGDERRTIDERDEWFELLAARFGLTLPEIDAPARDALWTRVSASHEGFLRLR